VLAVLYVLDVLYISSSQRVKEMSKRKTIDFLEQEVDIQSYANAHFNGDFTAAVRHYQYDGEMLITVVGWIYKPEITIEEQ
jgi:hypothetical protein